MASAQSLSGTTSNARVTVGRRVMAVGAGQVFYRVSPSTTWLSDSFNSTPRAIANFAFSDAAQRFLGPNSQVASMPSTARYASTQQAFSMIYTIEWTRNTAAGVQGTFNAGFATNITYSNTGTTTTQVDFQQVLPDYSINFGPTVPLVSDPLLDSTLRKDVILALVNNGTTDILMNWGSKFMTLKPGMNSMRYDGPVDFLGNPTVGPPDFQGTSLVSGGTNYIVGSLSPNGSGGGSWDPAPVVPPTAATSTRQQASVVTDTGLGARVNLLNSSGVTRSMVLGPIPPSTASNTTGSNAVLSSPTAEKPSPDATNTVVNITNNSTSNTNVGGSTSIITNTTSSGTGSGLSAYTGLTAEQEIANMNQANAINPATAVTPMTADGVLVPTGQAVTTLTGISESVTGKFQNFGNLVALQSIPRINSYTLTMNLGGWAGTVSRTIDFTALPFPPVRAAMVITMTLGFGVAFMKKITI